MPQFRKINRNVSADSGAGSLEEVVGDLGEEVAGI